MRILVLNCGSSTLKLELLELADSAPAERLARGRIERIGGNGRQRFETRSGEHLEQEVAVACHAEATRRALAWLDSRGLLEKLAACGHRVVHGGPDFSEPALVSQAVLERLEATSELAPLHNGPALEALRGARAALPRTPMVAVFDTAFHARMPERSARYAIPSALAERHAIRRYGFHGLAHRSLSERAAELMGSSLDGLKLVTLQLGNGCSAAAVKAGRSIDTTMGLTPLEGLMMGTRSGDVDPTLAGFIAQREGLELSAVEALLNRESGLKGVAGRSDMREVLAAARAGDAMAELAADMFCYRVRKAIAASMAALDGADAVVFGGGIGENAPEVRGRCLEGLGWCGLELDARRNARAVGQDALLSGAGSRVAVWAVRVDEETIIARDVHACLLRGA